MVKKTLGYVRLEWTCPNCDSKNPGPNKTCSNCGGAQPEDVEFEQAAQEEIVTDEKEVERAKAGPDIHCAYCGARNPAGAEKCTQCGADVKEGEARAHGEVLGAHRDEPVADVACPSCGALNPATAHECSQCGASMAQPEPQPRKQPAKAPTGGCSPVVLIAGVVIVLLAVFLGIFLTRPSDDIVGTVEDVSWTRSIPIEGLVPVTYETWRNKIPLEAVVGECSQRVHHTQDSPVPNSKEVCDSPYTVDTGSGYGEVVQECEYQVYADWCQYQVQEWRQVDAVTLTDHGLNARWPEPQLNAGQRQGTGKENYQIRFDTDGKTYTYTTRDPVEFSRFQDGSHWILKVNKLGGLVSVEPAQ